MLPNPWYYRKRLLIAASVAAVLAALWFSFQNRRYIISRLSPHRKKVSTKPPDVQNQHYPFMAFLYIQNVNRSKNCGGTLIGKSHLLTAAHCLYDASTVWIILGTGNLLAEDKSAVHLESERFLIHEDYDQSSYDNDIGLIYLDTEVSLNDNINVVSLSSDKTISLAMCQLVVLGWGLDESRGFNDQLLVKNVSVIDNCNSNFGDDPKICAVGEDGPSFGDSGGPLLLRGVQVGIVSGGMENDVNSTLAVFTNVAFYSEWIRKSIG